MSTEAIRLAIDSLESRTESGFAFIDPKASACDCWLQPNASRSATWTTSWHPAAGSCRSTRKCIGYVKICADNARRNRTKRVSAW